MTRARVMPLVWAAVGTLVLLGAYPAVAGDAYVAHMTVRELGSNASLRLRLLYDPDYLPVPNIPGHLFLVRADSAWGGDAFFLPTDLAFEVGETQIYRTEYEQASDLFGQALGGFLRPESEQVGFIVAPSQLRIEDYLPDHPDSVVIRYAHHRVGFRKASPAERAEWRAAIPPPVALAGLNGWWDWIRLIDQAPPMSEGDARIFAERIFPGQSQVLLQSKIDPAALQGAILRVGQRRLLTTPVTQRVRPQYPSAARQVGAEGLVVVLAYTSERGTVEDAVVLASETVHMLNYAAVAAALDWRYSPGRDEEGRPLDGWRLMPMDFVLGGEMPAEAVTAGEGGLKPPRILRKVTPEYPEKAYRARIEGTVVYHVTINSEGRMVAAALFESVHPLLDEAALYALERTRFAPATRDGQPVEADLLVPFQFPPEE